MESGKYSYIKYFFKWVIIPNYGMYRLLHPTFMMLHLIMNITWPAYLRTLLIAMARFVEIIYLRANWIAKGKKELADSAYFRALDLIDLTVSCGRMGKPGRDALLKELLRARDCYMKQTFDYLENVAFAATVCDKDGIVLYQNNRAIKRDGSVIGRNLYDCHNKRSGEMIRHMIETGESNTYEIIRHGRRRLLHQTPWYNEQDGEVAGLIELSIDLPDEYPTFNRD